MSISTSITSATKSVYHWVFPPSEELSANQQAEGAVPVDRIDWIRAIPFILMHVACVAVFWVGWSWLAVWIAVMLYAIRVFTLTGWYHRYFAHRSFKTWRIVQFVFAVIGCSAVQRGPLWWAAHHRHHHVHSDDPEDLHSPRQQGLVWAHFGWFLTPKAFPTNFRLIPDFAKFPELRFLDRYDVIVPILLGVGLFGFGELVASQVPDSGVTGGQLLVWGLFISTIACYHVTYLVNSATHVLGTRRYETKDDSRNNWLIALLTFGEGWHNNHHHYQNSARQGFFWWEIDITYYGLCFLNMLGLVWDLKAVPKRILHPQKKAVPENMQHQPAPVRALPS